MVIIAMVPIACLPEAGCLGCAEDGAGRCNASIAIKAWYITALDSWPTHRLVAPSINGLSSARLGDDEIMTTSHGQT